MKVLTDFIVNNIYEILYVVVTLISLVITVTNWLKAKKKVKTNEERAQIDAQALETLKLSINQFIKDAETRKHYTGDERKQFVMTRAMAVANGIMTEEEIDKYIEIQIDLTDNVNKHN